MRASFRRRWKDRRGEQFVEASLVLPAIILITVLILRLFTFYLQILTTQVKGHQDLMERARNERGVQILRDEKTVSMVQSEIFKGKLDETMEWKWYNFSEDAMVRAEAWVQSKE